MKYAQTATPIHTRTDLDAAVAAGDSIEFTACADAYDAPPCDTVGSFGWVSIGEARMWRDSLPDAKVPNEDSPKFESGEFRLRAFYPA